MTVPVAALLPELLVPDQLKGETEMDRLERAAAFPRRSRTSSRCL
jgi:hypothetical protein